MNHVSTIERRADKRIAYFQAGGKRSTICGAPISVDDLSWEDAVRAKRDGILDKWVSCPNCIAKVERAQNK